MKKDLAKKNFHIQLFKNDKLEGDME